MSQLPKAPCVFIAVKLNPSRKSRKQKLRACHGLSKWIQAIEKQDSELYAFPRFYQYFRLYTIS